MSIEWQTKGVYSFSVYPTIITTVFNNVTVLGVMAYEIATQHADLAALHISYYPYLPAGTPDDPELFDYLMVRLENGEVTILATVWIKENTVVENDSFGVQVLIEGIKTNDIIRLRDVLTVNGFNNYTIKNMSTGAIL